MQCATMKIEKHNIKEADWVYIFDRNWDLIRIDF